MKVPEVPSRPRDAATEGLIKDLLEEEEQAKANKRAAKEMQGRAPKKGKTLAEIEKDEGGVVRESMVAMAHTKRATARRGIKDAGGLGDVEVDVDIEAFEEDLEEDMDAEAAAEAADEERRRRAAAAGAADDNGGVKFEPFNLKYEREHGYFDEDGNYVEKVS